MFLFSFLLLQFNKSAAIETGLAMKKGELQNATKCFICYYLKLFPKHDLEYLIWGFGTFLLPVSKTIHSQLLDMPVLSSQKSKFYILEVEQNKIVECHV